ncbi:hypothetical protein V6N11_000461 [Hibiscus sabdariffa]|uniref:Reverse transcriptase zinc-binding domain-containing protein n=1 Tax=Hibiscus sabdariffa TaxID=183260 RepID=A0ABR2NT29_9ROSI
MSSNLGSGSGRVNSQAFSPRYSLVSDLIDPISHTWKTDVVNSVFDDDDASHILCIPLPCSPQPDVLVWKGDKSGEYSVKSGYRLLMGNLTLQVDGNDSSDQRTHGCFFSHLWKISLPSKVKISIWRFFHNYLPTFSNLQERRISINSCCPLCCQGPDSVHHIIQECSFSSQIFYRLKLNLSASSTISNWKEWLTQVSMVLSVHDQKLFVIALWAIWGHRNKLIHENCLNNLNSLLSSILSFAKEVDLVFSPNKVQSTTEESFWSPPHVGVVKANFDAAFNKEANCSFSGVIIRNHDGNMMAACSVFTSFIADPCIAEAKTCEQAVKLVKQFNFRKVIFEGDALTVIKKTMFTITRLVAYQYDRQQYSWIVWGT